MRVDDAIKFVQAKRGIVRPNMGFVKQLDSFAKQYSHLPPPKQENVFTKGIRRMKEVAAGYVLLSLYESGQSWR